MQTFFSAKRQKTPCTPRRNSMTHSVSGRKRPGLGCHRNLFDINQRGDKMPSPNHPLPSRKSPQTRAEFYFQHKKQHFKTWGVPSQNRPLATTSACSGIDQPKTQMAKSSSFIHNHFHRISQIAFSTQKIATPNLGSSPKHQNLLFGEQPTSYFKASLKRPYSIDRSSNLPKWNMYGATNCINTIPRLLFLPLSRPPTVGATSTVKTDFQTCLKKFSSVPSPIQKPAKTLLKRQNRLADPKGLPESRSFSDVHWFIDYDEENRPMIRFIMPQAAKQNEDLRRKKIASDAVSSKDVFKIISLDEEGGVEFQELSKKDILSTELLYDVQLRDLRMVTTQQHQRQISTIITKKDAIILKLEYLKAIICLNKVVIFDVDEIQVMDFVESLKKRLLANKHREETAVPQDPFEFCVLESMLDHVSETFENRLNFFTVVSDTFEKMTRTPDFKTLMRLVMFKQSLNYFETEVKEFLEPLEDMLESDEDLSSMYLSHRHVTGEARRVDDHTEVEMLFEGYFKKMQEISNEVVRLEKNLEDTTRLHEMSLDNTRNRLMHLNLQLSIFSTSINSGMLVAGIFGMNLLNHYEEHQSSFALVTLTIFAMTFVTYIFFLIWYLSSNARAATIQEVSKGWQSEIMQRHPAGFSFDEFKTTVEQAIGKRLTNEEAAFFFRCFDKNKENVVVLDKDQQKKGRL